MTFIEKGIRFWEELRLLGLEGALFRISFELKRRSGLDKLLKRPLSFPPQKYIASFEDDIPQDPIVFHAWWNSHAAPFFSPCTKEAKKCLPPLIGDSKHQILRRANKVLKGEFFCFRKEYAYFGNPPDWHWNPVGKCRWPLIHSSGLMIRSCAQLYGDCKLTWELGRFPFVPDLLRAYIFSNNTEYINTLFRLFKDFEDNNPVYLGLHWFSEQEVAIRSLMIYWAIRVLKDTNHVTPERLEHAFRLLFFHGIYLERNIEFARNSIKNNHLVAGGLGLYLLGQALFWVKQAEQWKKQGRDILVKSLYDQWYSDGGYVQPSHNYHRLTWHYFLWTLRIAQLEHDEELEQKIKIRLPNSLLLFSSMMDQNSGFLPNWGPNDGALLGIWTECDYSDFRPIINSMNYAMYGKKAFSSGPWDEDLFWHFGFEAVNAPSNEIKVSHKSHFPITGLHMFRPTCRHMGVMRCGSVISRYGQQADQLHVDIWWNGVNLALDAGSYNYNNNLKIHNWFRGTASHNTVTIGDQDQMIPYRQFKYLKWTKAHTLKNEVSIGHFSLIGIHNGYERLPGKWLHARMLTWREGMWIVVDRIWSQNKLDNPQSVKLHWQFINKDCEYDANKRQVQLILNKNESCFINLISSSVNWETDLVLAQEEPFDGWVSRYYNHMDPAWAFRGHTWIDNQVWFATCFSEYPIDCNFDFKEKKLICGDNLTVQLEEMASIKKFIYGFGN